MLTSIIKIIQQLDEQLLLLLNGAPSWAAEPMWLASKTWIWLPLYGWIVLAVVRASSRTGQRAGTSIKWRSALGGILFLCATFAATDAVSSRVFKPGFERLRPSHAPALEGQLILHQQYRGGQYGFLSSHAANTFGLAAAFILLLGRARWLWFWAAAVTYTRLYLGVHYPTDVLAGAMLGVGCAAALRFLHLRIQPGIINLRSAQQPRSA